MKSGKILKLLTYVLATAVMATALVYYNFIDKAVPTVGAGVKCPDITVSVFDREGDGFVERKKTVSVSDYQGKIVILNFWSTTCGSCMLEMPHFDEFQKAYIDDVVILALNGEKGKSYEKILGWMNARRTTHGMREAGLNVEEIYKWETFDITFGWYDVENNDVGVKLGFSYNWPSTAIVNRNGFIQRTHVGEMSYADLEEIVRPML